VAKVKNIRGVKDTSQPTANVKKFQDAFAKKLANKNSVLADMMKANLLKAQQEM
jgi:hypothetical protein